MECAGSSGGSLERSSVDLNVIGLGESLLVVKVAGQREYSYKIPIFAQVLVGLYVGSPYD